MWFLDVWLQIVTFVSNGWSWSDGRVEAVQEEL